jgi:hypothetical protein
MLAAAAAVVAAAEAAIVLAGRYAYSVGTVFAVPCQSSLSGV